MNKTHFYITLLLIFTNSFSQAQKKSESATLHAKIDSYLTNATKNGFSGAISVVKNGKLIINKGYGVANKETKTLNNSNTIFDIGSNTKQFTAAAILKLVELDKLKLTDPLSTFFKNLPIDKQQITIHQLLSHSAGFIDAIGRDFTKTSQKDFFEKLFSSKLLSNPGEKYSYSNTGYSILGRIIEIVSEQSYEAFINKYLFKPAGMKQTGYLLPKWNTKRISRSYNRGVLESESTIIRYQKDGKVNWHLKANGGINSTQNDMLLWYKALKSNRILSKESLKKLTASHIKYTNGKYKYAYAYGWTVRILENKMKRLSHNGSNGAYSHTVIWFPKEDTFIVYATNANSSKVEFAAYAVTKIILEKNYVPKPIKNNVYSFAINFIKDHSTNKFNNLISLLKEKYPNKFTSSFLLNTIGNLLLKMNKDIDWALELFKYNVKLYPKDGNLWDSLGDGYKANNLKKDAVKSYLKAVELGNKDSQKKITELTKN